MKVKRDEPFAADPSGSTDSYFSLYQKSIDDPEQFWGSLASDYLHWDEPFKKVIDCDMEKGKIKWFTGGKLNASGRY